MRELLWGACMTLAAATAQAETPCGGDFNAFIQGLKADAVVEGISSAQADAFFQTVRHDPEVLRADGAQGVFQKPFIDFSRALISTDRLNRGISNGQKHDAIFTRVETEFGVDRGVLLAFWAFETDYGTFQGDNNTANALVTLAHDCRRPELFRPQVIAAIKLFARGAFDPATTTGAWAGEIGMVQMLPKDILENGIDGDGDGQVSLKTSVADALMSGGKMLQSLGWTAGQPWLEEVVVPAGFDWSLSGLETTLTGAEWAALGLTARDGGLAENLQASLLSPQGHKGPTFLAYPNFNVYFEWNQSFTYVLTAAYFANRLKGAPIYKAGNPDQGLSSDQMKHLQTQLRAKGYDVGAIDGILGAGTRSAVRAEQKRLGMPADGWPTITLLTGL